MGQVRIYSSVRVQSPPKVVSVVFFKVETFSTYQDYLILTRNCSWCLCFCILGGDCLWAVIGHEPDTARLLTQFVSNAITKFVNGVALYLG